MKKYCFEIRKTNYVSITASRSRNWLLRDMTCEAAVAKAHYRYWKEDLSQTNMD